MANAGIPPSGKNANMRESHVIINADSSDQSKLVDDHFRQAMRGQVYSRQYAERNLPEEFFSKPSTTAKSSANTSVAHSRDGSTDSSGRFTMSPPAAYMGPAGISVAATTPGIVAAGIHHSRTQSSPATLNTHMSLPPAGPFATAHGRSGSTISGQPARATHQQKHRSVDNTLDSDKTPLPYGWERKFTESGQPFYLNSIDKTTTWEDPRKTLSASNLSQNVAQNSTAANFGPLPPGWEEAFSPTGDKYFINHNDKSTSWYDPRLPEEVQKPMIMQRLMSQQTPGQRQMSSSCAIGNPPNRYANPPPQHRNLLQQPPATMNRSMATGASAAAAAASFSPMIQELNQERQRIYERNLELRDQGLLDRLSPVHHPLSPSHNVGNDAFLGVGASSQYGGPGMGANHYPMSSTDFHMRQESSDSGLGMPVGYPHTPENYLGSSDIDLSFNGISLMDSNSMQMDVDPTNIPATLDNINMAPNELDQYLNN